MLKPLTPSQKRVYEFYKDYIKKHKESPTYSIASSGIGISESAIFKQIKNLESLWYLSKDSWGNIIYDNNQIRVLWYISCWYWIDLVEEDVDIIDVPRKMIKSWFNYYALIAKWDSMINANISDWDTLIIRQQDDIDSWDIWVVVKEDDTVTLKRVYKRPNDILLKPENDDFSPILLKDCQVRGKLIGVIRNF